MNFRVFFPTFARPLLLASTLVFCPILTAKSANKVIELPSLGDSTSAFSNPAQELLLGQNWLRAFRRQAPIQEDPLVYAYLHDLIRRLAYHSPLSNKQFSLVIVDSPAFNAFAVPGQVIGVNTGLLSYADTEDQLASVLAHELAHLSQRHYARSMQRQESTQALTMAALLGSLLILAAGSPEAGMAALTATQAAAISDRLKYSRLHEQEADRIGMQTLADSGMNPAAVANMFQHMLLTMRYRQDIKEFDFLLTHPLTDSRVSDAFNHARSYPSQHDQDNFAFHLVKARIHVLNSKNPQADIKYFQRQRESATFKKASDYGLALALTKAGQLDKAEKTINTLYRESPNRKAYVLAKAELLKEQQKYAQSSSLLELHLSLSPYNYPYSMALAQVYLLDYKAKRASEVLKDLTRHGYRHQPDIWYLLAEAEGLSGNIAGVHLARAEFFMHIGAFTQAQRHLKLALPLIKDDLQATARVQIKIQNVERMRQAMQF
ncbi:MAG: M48 family metallopeptidase [Pseudomonadales bacterium]|nr:M48 family metallopeptidase [Pseudomonadales bacterium]